MKDRKLLMIPGPVEFSPAVLRAMGMPTASHVAPNFIEVFGQALERLRYVFLCPSGQPFVVAGSGTFAMDMAAANLVEPGDQVLVVNTGLFSDRFGAILQRYGALVTHVHAPAIGDVPALQDVQTVLEAADYKVMTITHVDTSTGVRADVRALAELGRQHELLVLVDGVCATAGEELDQEGWGVDLVLTASQKAIGVPPGLALVMAGTRAIEAFRARRVPVGSYYADWNQWLPIMEAYEARRPSYFGTPPVNLIWALNISLAQILQEGMTARFARHRHLSDACKAGIAALGMDQVPASPEVAAATLTAPRYPEGVDSSVLGRINDEGVILAGGLHPEIKDQYFRIGHMGVVTAADIVATLGAIERALAAVGYRLEAGVGIQAAQQALIGASADVVDAPEPTGADQPGDAEP